MSNLNWKTALMLCLLILGTTGTTLALSLNTPTLDFPEISSQMADDTITPEMGDPVDGPSGPH